MNEMSDKVNADYLMGMREIVPVDVVSPGKAGGFPCKYIVNSVHRGLDTALLHRDIDLYKGRQKGLAMCKRALILPKGNLSTVSIDEINVTDILNYEWVDNKYSEVLEDCSQSFTKEMINNLNGTHDLT